MNNRSSYHNSFQAGEILPDSLFTTLYSPLTMLPTSKGSACSPLPAAQTSLDPFRTLFRAFLRSPGYYEPMGCLHIYVLVCLFVCVFVCVSVCACVSLTSYACFHMSLLVCFHVSMCLSVPFWLCICLCDCVSENVFVCVCLCPCTVVGESLGLTSEGEAYLSRRIIQSPALVSGIQLSSPL